MFQDHLLSLIEQEGYDAAHFPDPAAFTYDTETILHTLWGSPFSILYRFLVELGLTPQVLLEPQGEDKDRLWVCSLSTYEDINCISLFLSEASKVRQISKQCDLTILNFGRMLVVAPRLFRWFKFTLKPPYTIASGNLLLAIWDTSHWTSFVKLGLKTA